MAMLIRDMATKFWPRLNQPSHLSHISNFKELLAFYTSGEKDFVSGKQKSAIFAFFVSSRRKGDSNHQRT
jgi:hypothetical protein